MIKFTLPSDLSGEAARGLEQATLTAGPDNFPTPSQAHVEPSELALVREEDNSGRLSVPWIVKGAGQIVLRTGTLPTNSQPRNLLVELARGRVNQIRNLAFDWQSAGFKPSPGLQQQIRDASLAFCRGLARFPSEESAQLSNRALVLSCEAASQLVQEYSAQVVQVLQNRRKPLNSVFSCHLGSHIPDDETTRVLTSLFNAVTVPFPVQEIVPAEGDYDWAPFDDLVDWALANNFEIIGGPLVDFSASRIPQWLWLWERDRGRIAKFLCEYTADVLERYHDRITTWQLTTGGNIPGILSLSDQELLWLTLQMGETAKHFSPESQLIISLSQPWGDYNTSLESRLTPIDFADMLLRSGLPFAAIDLEVVMGIRERGSYCRDVLDFISMVETFGTLDVPLFVTLGYPSSSDLDCESDPDLHPDEFGYWKEPFSPQMQSDWAAEFATAALCLPCVDGVQWVQASDKFSHQFPNCGLFDQTGNARPVVQRLKRIHDRFLK